MKIAIVYNRESKNVINLFGIANREKIGLQTVKRIVNALRAGNHQVTAIEGDKDLIKRLEEFMPKVVAGERPGMVFNLSYGIQGQARYTHIPSILEMVGIPYVGSGPTAHSIALDKVVTKMMLKQHGLPTPDFTVVTSMNFDMPDLDFPLIVKPGNEAVSLGIRVANNEEELREGVKDILENYHEQVLIESYIEGREINVALLGNKPPATLPPAEIVFGKGGPAIYTFEDKTHRSDRDISIKCPAPLSKKLTLQAQELAIKTFTALGCCDCARVDMRLDKQGNFQILEINSLPSLGENSSFVTGAEHAGLDFNALINRIVDVAATRYFGTPSPPQIEPGSQDDKELSMFNFITSNREQMESRLKDLSRYSTRSEDMVGIRTMAVKFEASLIKLGLRKVSSLSDDPFVWTFETKGGLVDGTLLIAHLDVPLPRQAHFQAYHKSAEHIHGEGVGSSRAPMVSIEFALRALRHIKKLSEQKIGILLYADEGLDCAYSSQIIVAAAAKAKQVIVLRPGNPGDKVITQRRGLRQFRLHAHGGGRRIGKIEKNQGLLQSSFKVLEEMSSLSNAKDKIAVEPLEISTESFRMHGPHRVESTIALSYLEKEAAQAIQDQMKRLLDKNKYRWHLETISDRPPMNKHRNNRRLVKRIVGISDKWGIPLAKETSLAPSVAGLVPKSVPVICGMGPVAEKLSSPTEAVYRISLVQRTILLTMFLFNND